MKNCDHRILIESIDGYRLTRDISENDNELSGHRIWARHYDQFGNVWWEQMRFLYPTRKQGEFFEDLAIIQLFQTVLSSKGESTDTNKVIEEVYKPK